MGLDSVALMSHLSYLLGQIQGTVISLDPQYQPELLSSYSDPNIIINQCSKNMSILQKLIREIKVK